MTQEKTRQAVIITLETANIVAEFLGKCPWNDVQHFLSDYLAQARTTIHDLPPIPVKAGLELVEKVIEAEVHPHD